MFAACLAPGFILMVVCMLMTASTELGSGQWIPNILSHAGVSGILVLVWINGLMAVGRSFAGPFVHKLSPIGMLVMTLPWHWLGLNGQWRRVAHFDYADPVIAWWGPWVVVSLIGGVLLAASAFLFVWNLWQLHEKPASVETGAAPFAYALPLHPVARVPALTRTTVAAGSMWSPSTARRRVSG